MGNETGIGKKPAHNNVTIRNFVILGGRSILLINPIYYLIKYKITNGHFYSDTLYHEIGFH